MTHRGRLDHETGGSAGGKAQTAAAIVLAAATAMACLPILHGALAFMAPAAMAAAKAMPPPVTFTVDQDHRNMMEQLGIEALRPGASGDENDPAHANYDELLANPYPRLPDPLRLDDGEEVTTAGAWWQERRPQIIAALEETSMAEFPQTFPG